MDSTILIPTYNQRPAYLRAAILSAVKQTIPCQIVVMDDGSDPPQESIVSEIEKECDYPITYAYQANSGVAAALNAALDMAVGEYIQWLSSDDLFRPEKTIVQMQAMIDADMSVCYCAWEEGVPQAGNVWPAAQYPSQESLMQALRQHCFINACTVMWRRDVFDTVGRWDVTYRHAQDYHHLLRCAERYNFLAVNEPLVRRRVHAGQMIQTLKQETEKAIKAEELGRLRERYDATAEVWIPL